jgi:hypothetical protein
MRYRKRRIAWTVGSGVACVLLTVLWVRSYWRSDSVTKQARITSFNGRIIHENKYWDGNSHIYWEIGRSPNRASAQWFKTTGLIWQYPSVVATAYWCPALLLATVAIAPWMRWSKRFSLRTLLIATTLVAVMLGVIVWANH